MKKLITSILLFSTFSSFASVIFDQSYTVRDDSCSMLFISNGASISERIPQNSNFKLFLKNNVLSSSRYQNYSISGEVYELFIHRTSLRKKFNKNTITEVFQNDDSLIFEQTTQPFSFYYFRELCNPYDFTGISCVFGLVNPGNWIPRKAHFDGIQYRTVIKKFDHGDVEYIRYQIERNLETITHQCKLVPTL